MRAPWHAYDRWRTTKKPGGEKEKEDSSMLTHSTDQRLVALGLTGMAKALEDQQRQPEIAALPFEDRLGLLVDREAIERENKRLTSRLKSPACARTRSSGTST